MLERFALVFIGLDLKKLDMPKEQGVILGGDPSATRAEEALASAMSVSLVIEVPTPPPTEVPDPPTVITEIGQTGDTTA